jgi:hypothetical protein
MGDARLLYAVYSRPIVLHLRTQARRKAALPDTTSLPLRNYVVILMTCMLAVLFQLARQIDRKVTASNAFVGWLGFVPTVLPTIWSWIKPDGPVRSGTKVGSPIAPPASGYPNIDELISQQPSS